MAGDVLFVRQSTKYKRLTSCARITNSQGFAKIVEAVSTWKLTVGLGSVRIAATDLEHQGTYELA